MKHAILLTIMFFCITVPSVFSVQNRWDLKMVESADEWVLLWSDIRSSAIGPWRYNKNEWMRNLKKYPEGQYSDDNRLMLGFYALNYSKDLQTAFSISREILNGERNEKSILNPSLLVSFDGFIIDPVWSFWAGILISKDRDGNIKTKNVFAEPLIPSQIAALKYFSHLEQFPRRTKDFAYFLSALSIKENAVKVKLFKDYLKKNREEFVIKHSADRTAAKEEYGVYIFNIKRIYTAATKFLALELKKNGDIDQAISVLENFTNTFCDDGWHGSFNELLGDYYFEKGGEENAKKAIRQYTIAQQGWFEEKKNECRKTSLGIPMAPQESSLFSEEGYLRHWRREFNRIKDKIEKAGGKLPVNFDDEIKKLKDFYSSIRRTKPISEGWNLQSVSYTPDELKTALAKNNIESLKKWSQDFTHGTKAIEKLGTSPEGLNVLEGILIEAPAEKSKSPRHLHEILTLLNKSAKLNVKQLLKTVRNEKIKESLYNFLMETLPEGKALDLCFQKVQEYANDPDAHVDELCMFLKGFGNRWDVKSLKSFSKQLGNGDTDLSSREKRLAIIGEWISLDQETQNIINDMISKIMLDANERSKAEFIRIIGMLKNPVTLKYIPFESEEHMAVIAEAVAEYFHCKSDIKLHGDTLKEFMEKIKPLIMEMSDVIKAPYQKGNILLQDDKKREEITRNLTKEESIALKEMMDDKNKSLEELRLLDKIMNASSDEKIRDKCRKALGKWLKGYSSCRDFIVSIATPLISSSEESIRASAIEVLGNSTDLYNLFLLEPYLEDKNQKIRNCAMQSCNKLLFLHPSATGENIKEKIQKIKDIFFAIQTEYSSASGAK